MSDIDWGNLEDGTMIEGKGHWCKFCQCIHTSMSCFHPGRQFTYELQALADERLELLKDAPLPPGKFTKRTPAAMAAWVKQYSEWYEKSRKVLDAATDAR